MKNKLLCKPATLLTLVVLLLGGVFEASAQQISTDGTAIVSTHVFTMVVPNYNRMTAGDNSVAIRELPSALSRKLGDIYYVEGLSNSVLLSDSTGKWLNVGGYKTTGYSNSYYLNMHTWYIGTGSPCIIADGLVAVFVESMAGPDEPGQYDRPFCYIQNGTIIADQFEETEHDYVLKTVHTDLLIPKTAPIRKVAR